MAYEATIDLTLESLPVETPLEPTTGWHISGKKLTLVPILRAGLGMVEGILRLVPAARVGHIGLYRDHERNAAELDCVLENKKQRKQNRHRNQSR